jgi:DNA-binding helix-hairpin-helix protein with protein kinase domain
LTGRLPFAAPPYFVALAGGARPAPTPIADARVPGAVRALITECLAEELDRRPRVHSVLSALTWSAEQVETK